MTEAFKHRFSMERPQGNYMRKGHRAHKIVKRSVKVEEKVIGLFIWNRTLGGMQAETSC